MYRTIRRCFDCMSLMMGKRSLEWLRFSCYFYDKANWLCFACIMSMIRAVGLDQMLRR